MRAAIRAGLAILAGCDGCAAGAARSGHRGTCGGGIGRAGAQPSRHRSAPHPAPATGNLIIVHLVKPGTRVKRGDLVIEFDRQAQLKTAHDREAEYRDFVEQINLDPVQALHYE